MNPSPVVVVPLLSFGASKILTFHIWCASIQSQSRARIAVAHKIPALHVYTRLAPADLRPNLLLKYG